MNDVQFEVCSEIGSASPNWQLVRSQYDDTRQSGGEGDIRFYTFPSGSVTARYIKWKNRGGTSTANYRYFSHFGVYNFSGSCAASNTLDPNSVAGGFAHAVYGGPTSSMCQVELANTKNFAVGDYIYFWSKQMLAPGKMFGASYSGVFAGYKDMNSVTGYYDKTFTQEGVLGGFISIHQIKAMNGNIVTLDKAITHTHIDDGTMAYKYNRGKVNLIGDRATPFTIARYTSNNRLNLSNVTFINGAPHNYNGAQYANLGSEIFEDIGMGNHASNYGLQGRPGFYRNIVANYLSLEGATPYSNMSTSSQIMAFNVLTTYNRATFAKFCMKLNDHVANFNVSLARHYVPYVVEMNNLYGNSAIGGRAIITNNYFLGGHNNDVAMTGGVTTNLGEQNQIDQTHELIVEGNVSPLGFSYQYYSQYNENYAFSPLSYRKNVVAAKNHITRNHWHFPSYNNPRFRPHYAYGNNVAGVGTGNQSTYFTFGRNPILITADKVQRFGQRPYIMLGEYYYMISVVKSRTFNTDKLFEAYLNGNSGGSQVVQSNASMAAICCKFKVLDNNTQVKIDISLIYKMTLFRLYGTGIGTTTVNRNFNKGGDSTPTIVIVNDLTNEVLDSTFLANSQLTDASSSKTFTLDKGNYSVRLKLKDGTYRMSSKLMSFKDLGLSISTPDTSKVHIIYNNWDFLKLFDNVTHYANLDSSPFTENSGKNRVLRQSTDLTKKLKFNKVKL